MIKDDLTGFECEFSVNGVYVPKGCFLVCPKCAETRDLFVSKNPKCPVCNVPYIVSTGITYDDENKPLRYTITANKGKQLEITEIKKE